MRQVLLCGTRQYSGMSMVVWAPDSAQVGQQYRWNGAPWNVRALYGTHFALGFEARKREKPDENPLERYS